MLGVMIGSTPTYIVDSAKQGAGEGGLRTLPPLLRPFIGRRVLGLNYSPVYSRRIIVEPETTPANKRVKTRGI